MNNFHKTDESKTKIFSNFLNILKTPGGDEYVNKTNSLRRKSPLYGYLIKHKWYERKISNTFSEEEEINEALRSQKDNKSVGMNQIPSGIFKIFRIKWVAILKNIFNEIHDGDMIRSWKTGIIVYI